MELRRESREDFESAVARLPIIRAGEQRGSSKITGRKTFLGRVLMRRARGVSADNARRGRYIPLPKNKCKRSGAARTEDEEEEGVYQATRLEVS